MIEVNGMYANNARVSDIVKVISIEYIDGVKIVNFERYPFVRQLPIEDFTVRFTRI